MRRRTLLATVAGALTAGCGGTFGTDPTPDTVTAVPVPATPSPTPTTTSTESGSPTAVSGCDGKGYRQERPPRVALFRPPQQYDDLGCPSSEWAGRILCYHTATPERAPVLLVPHPHVATVADDRGDVVEFVLVNRTDDSVTIRQDTWAILTTPAQTDRWEPIALGRRGCRRDVAAGGVHWWRIGVGTRPGLATAVNETAGSVDLDPGIYALALPVSVGDTTDIGCLAPFTVRRVESTTQPTEV